MWLFSTPPKVVKRKKKFYFIKTHPSQIALFWTPPKKKRGCGNWPLWYQFDLHNADKQETTSSTLLPSEPLKSGNQKLLVVMQNMAEVIQLLHNLHTLSSNKRKRLTLLLLMSMTSAAFLTHIPRLTDDTALPWKDPSHFEEIQFKDHFRFRKQDLYRVLAPSSWQSTTGTQPL
jgi:hypothetical protein